MFNILVPLRISFVGGGTDYEGFFKYYPGRVINMTIDKYVHLTIGSRRDIEGTFSARRYLIVSSDGREIHNNLSLAESVCVQEALKHFTIPGDVGIGCDSDVPINGSSLGSLGSFVVGLIYAFITFEGRNWDKREIAERAYEFERKILGEPGGKQDQYAAVLGGFNYFQFSKQDSGNSFVRRPIDLSLDRLDNFLNHLMLFDSGFTKEPRVVLSEQQLNIPSCFRTLRELSDLVLEFQCELEQGSFVQCGKLLDEFWNLKKKLSSTISSPRIDEIYDRATRAGGALGGKILGPGGGGYLLLCVRPEERGRLRKALSDLKEMQFKFDPNGVRIV